MIVQCEACQTRFRLADEKVKVGGIKVRCSKCKEVFTVMPPEPEFAEDTVDYGSFNMEKVADEAPAGDSPTNEEPPSETSVTEDAAAAEESAQEESSDLDFSGLLKIVSIGIELVCFGIQPDRILFTDTRDDVRSLSILNL